MRLYFLRHGIAMEREAWSGSDEDRPLTDRGRDRVMQVAKVMRKMRLRIEGVPTSPLLRARRTAELVHERLGSELRFEIDARLSPGFSSQSLENILREQGGTASLLLVGHEPDFSRVITALAGGGQIVMKKAGLGRVDIEVHNPLNGKLVFLAPPKLLLNFTAGAIPQSKVDGLADIFQAFRSLVAFFKPQKLRACATSAMREAENGSELAEQIWKQELPASSRGTSRTGQYRPELAPSKCRCVGSVSLLLGATVLKAALGGRP